MRVYDYEGIKGLAKFNERKITDYLALAPQNDPFYVGTPADLEQAAWFMRVWRAANYSGGVHLRRIHYWIVSQDPPILKTTGEVYENTDKCWGYLVQTSKKARYLGLIDIADIVDNKNPDPHIHAEYKDEQIGFSIHKPELDNPVIWLDGLFDSSAQPYHLEIWCEKSTMNDVLLPICQRYNANLVTFEGEVSITACNDFVERVKESGYKPARVFYISDFDPAGNSMPVAMSRKVEYIIAKDGGTWDIKIKPLALTSTQVKTYRLPRIPIKETEKRAGKFEAVFGSGAVELDALEALHPRVLGRIVGSALAPYYSMEAHDLVERKKREFRAAIMTEITAISDQYKDEIAAVQTMLTDIQNISLDLSQFEVEQFDAAVGERWEDWLFDSSRGYMSQIDFYKEHKGVDQS